MATQVIMPQLGESVVEGTVGHWLIAEGQPVKEYESLLTVTTDKVDTEIPAPASGTLLKILVGEGETVAAGTPLAVIGEPGEDVSAAGGGGGAAHGAHEKQVPAEPEERQPAGEPAAARQVEAAFNAGPGGSEPGRQENGAAGAVEPNATPVALRMAQEHGLDLAQVEGSGPQGRITKEDVEIHLAGLSGEIDRGQSHPEPDEAGRSTGFISPAVARVAAEYGVDLNEVVGTGEGGRITKKDVMAYIAAPVPRGQPLPSGRPAAKAGGDDLPPWERPGTGSLFRPSEEIGQEEAAPAAPSTPPSTRAPQAPRAATPAPSGDDGEIVPLSNMRRAIAKHMVISKQTSPHVTTVMEADLTAVVRVREKLRGEYERQGVKLTFTPFFIQAIVAGLRRVPEANSTFQDENLLLHRRIHIGMATAIADGLIVPVIRDADEKSLLGLARTVNDLAERARTKRLNPDEVQGATFTLTNHGTSGSLFATPIINQPQAGILGVGAIQKRPVVIARGHPVLPDAEDFIAIRPMVYLSFTFDHRILDGQGADGFLAAVTEYLEGYKA